MPTWFHNYAEPEAKATQIRTCQVQVVHGLLQTEDYAKAVLRPARPHDHVRYRHTARFTVIGNHLAQHPRLSLTAIGLGVHIQSLPDGVCISIKALAARFSEGEITIAKALRELEKEGYLSRTRERTAQGRFVTLTIAYDKPPTTEAAPPPPRPAPTTPAPASTTPPPAPPAPTARPLPRAHRIAADALASLRTRDPRLLLSEHDVRRLAPAFCVWLERGVEPAAVVSTLLTALPPNAIRRPAGLIAHRLTQALPVPLPHSTAAARTPPRPPLQTCDGCDRAFRSPAPGRCGDCRPLHTPPATAA